MFDLVNYNTMVSHSYFLVMSTIIIIENCLSEVLMCYKEASLDDAKKAKDMKPLEKKSLRQKKLHFKNYIFKNQNN